MLSKQSNRYHRGTVGAKMTQFNEDIEEERMVTCDSDSEDGDVVNLSQREVIVDTEQSEFRKLPKMNSFESMCEIENDQNLLSSMKMSPQKRQQTLISSAEFISTIEKQQ